MRLREALGSIISPCKSGLVGERQIVDAIFVANEATDELRRDRRGVVLKFDFEKVYDMVKSFSIG